MGNLLIGDDGEFIRSIESADYSNIAPVEELFFADPDNEWIITGEIPEHIRSQQR